MSYFYESYPINALVAGHDGVEGLEANVYLSDGGSSSYETNLRLAHDFIRRNGDRRYSRRTLNGILRAADQAEMMRVHGVDTTENFPALFTLGCPVSYDEETEVKAGGMVGVGVLFDDDDGKFVLATVPGYRRRGIGRLLVNIARAGVSGAISVHVSQHNHTGQQFLSACQFFPVSITSAGTVCYASTLPMPEGQEDEYYPQPRRRRPNFS